MENDKNLLSLENYKFIKDIPNILLVGYGGSIAYGTAVPSSDIDIRGIYMNPINEILGIDSDSEQYVDNNIDTTIYSFKKMIKLLVNCNPNTIEILGLKPEHYLQLSEAGKLLLKNKNIFLSQKAIYTFGNYADSQLNRLVNKRGRTKSEIAKNETRSIDKVLRGFESRYKKYAETKSDINVSEKDNTVFLNMKLNNLPLETAIQMLNELVSVNKSYSKSVRNDKAVEHGKIEKHMMHLIRLYLMGIDILEKGEIITYRKNEHDLLMAIRGGYFLESDKKTPTQEFEALLSEYKKRFQRATQRTLLPAMPNYDAINKLSIDITKMYL